MFWWIQSVYVKPELRGRGIYSALYAKAQELANTAAQAGASMALQRAQLQNETFKILTPEQREKLAQRQDGRRDGRRQGPAPQDTGRS